MKMNDLEARVKGRRRAASLLAEVGGVHGVGAHEGVDADGLVALAAELVGGIATAVPLRQYPSVRTRPVVYSLVWAVAFEVLSQAEGRALLLGGRNRRAA